MVRFSVCWVVLGAFIHVLENLTLYGVVVGVIGWMSICYEYVS